MKIFNTKTLEVKELDDYAIHAGYQLKQDEVIVDSLSTDEWINIIKEIKNSLDDLENGMYDRLTL